MFWEYWVLLIISEREENKAKPLRANWLIDLLQRALLGNWFPWSWEAVGEGVKQGARSFHFRNFCKPLKMQASLLSRVSTLVNTSPHTELCGPAAKAGAIWSWWGTSGASVFVSSHCRNKTPVTGWLRSTETYYPALLEVRGPASRCQRGLPASEGAGVICFRPSPSSWWHLGLWQRNSTLPVVCSLCACLYPNFPFL